MKGLAESSPFSRDKSVYFWSRGSYLLFLKQIASAYPIEPKLNSMTKILNIKKRENSTKMYQSGSKAIIKGFTLCWLSKM